MKEQILSRPFLPVLLAALVFVSAASASVLAADGGEWWNENWRYRIGLTVPDDRAVARVRTVAARFPIPEGCHPAGKDVRVVDSRGRLCPFKVLFFEPALYGYLAFEMTEVAPNYWIYLGNPRPGPRPAAWEPRAGVFLETRRYEGGGIRNWREFRDTITRSKHAFGAGFRPKIWDGFNPYGEPDNFISLYTAYFQVRRRGEYTFCTVSDDASFLRVDGKMVCQNPGRHTVARGRRGEFNGRIRLDAGVHLLEYYHVDLADEQTALAGWRFPGEEQFHVMEANSFVPIRHAFPGKLEERDAALTPDFTASQFEWIKAGDGTLTLYDFADASRCVSGRVVERAWRFSDGFVSREPAFRKVFFRPGDFEVTLTVKNDKGQTATTTRLFRVHAIDKMSRLSEREIQNLFLGFFHGLKPAGWKSEDLVAAARFLRDVHYPEQAARVYEWAFDANKKAGGSSSGRLLVEFLQLGGKNLRAEKQLEELGQRLVPDLPDDDPERGDAFLELGKLQLRLGRADAAYASLQSALVQLERGGEKKSALRREILIAIGDACRLLKKPGEALTAYRKAQALPEPAPAKPYDVSSYALTVEAYITQKDYAGAQEILDEWVRQYPVEKMTGYASVLQARVLAGTGRRAEAIRELELFLAGDPKGVFAQTALEDLGDYYAVDGKKTKGEKDRKNEKDGN